MNKFFRVGLALISIVAIFPSLLLADMLPSSINTMVSKNHLNQNSVAIYVKETGKNEVIASLNIDKEMIPASVIKVYSAYAILLELGFNYRWPTGFYMTGKLQNGVLNGDLIVKGFGDPTLETADLPKIVAALKAKGIRSIRGNIVIDRSYFSVPKQDSSNFDKNIYSAYNAMPDAMMFNQHLSRFSIASYKGRHQVQKEFPGESYQVSNSIRSVSGSCEGARSWPSIRVDHSTETPVLRVSGALSTKCGRRSYTYIVTKSYKEFYAALTQKMKLSGIGYNGRMKIGILPSSAKNLYTHYSQPLEEIIAITAKKSNNLFARHLLLTLGAKIYGPPANLDKGRRAVTQILNRYRLLDTPRCYIDNGCGLSQVSKITARSMARVLDHAYEGYGKRWMNILAIAGTDGTIKRRFQNTSVKNRAWMKTGTLDNAKNIVGYVKSKSGKLYTVVILVNGKGAKWRGANLENDIIKWLVDYRGSGVSGGRDLMREAFRQKDQAVWGDIDKAAIAGNYYIQVGSFNTSPKDIFLTQLQKKGLAYRIINDGSRFKVMVGPYTDRTQAKKALTAIKKEIPGAYVVQL